jgi:hypothetical protein
MLVGLEIWVREANEDLFQGRLADIVGQILLGIGPYDCNVVSLVLRKSQCPDFLANKLCYSISDLVPYYQVIRT